MKWGCHTSHSRVTILLLCLQAVTWKKRKAKCWWCKVSVFVNQILASKALKMRGSLLRSYWTWELQSWKSCYILNSIRRSALVMSFGRCYTYFVEKKLLLVTGRICILGVDMNFLFSVAVTSSGDSAISVKDVPSAKKVHILCAIWKIISFRYWAVQWVYRLCRNLPVGKKPWR